MVKKRIALVNVTHSVTGLFYPAGTEMPVEHLSDDRIKEFEDQGILAQAGDPRILRIGLAVPTVIPPEITLREKT